MESRTLGFSLLPLAYCKLLISELSDGTDFIIQVGKEELLEVGFEDISELYVGSNVCVHFECCSSDSPVRSLKELLQVWLRDLGKELSAKLAACLLDSLDAPYYSLSYSILASVSVSFLKASSN